jgi:hypothetical protein
MNATLITSKGIEPMTNKRLAQIEMRIDKIKGELAEMGEMRPGSLTMQYKDPETQSGPYYQLSYTLDMKSRTEYIRREHVSDICRQIRNYKRFKKLSVVWIALSIEHSRLAMKLARNQ